MSPKLTYTILCALLFNCCFEELSAQSNISRIEYFVDIDPGYGNATSLVMAPSTNLFDLNLPLDITMLSSGAHQLFVRAQNADGNWSLTNRWLFYKPYDAPAALSPPVNIQLIEYTIDDNPPVTIPLSEGSNISDLIIPVDPSSLNQGVHQFFIRAKDTDGKWSLTNRWLFYKPNPPPSLPELPKIIQLEYFVDTDPGPGMGIQIPITPSTSIADLIVPLNMERFSPCGQRLFVRAKDSSGAWSMINSYSFTNNYISPTATPQDYMVQFDGQNDYLDLGTWFNKQKFTLSFWVKPDSVQVNGPAIAAIQNDLYFYSNPTVRNNYVLSHLMQFDLLPNEWNHVTISVDGTTNTRKVYLFGQLIDESQWNYAPQNGFNLRFGNGGFFPNAYFKGSLDDIKLWDKLLSPDSIYLNISKPLQGNEAGLLGYWNFNNGCDTFAIDITGNNHTAILKNGLAKRLSTVPNIGQQVIPSKGGNTNIVTVKIYDNLFQQGAVAKLSRDGFTDIFADNTIVSNDGSIATISFNLSGKDTGLYNIVITNPDTTIKVYSSSFTIEQGTAPTLSVDILGRNVVRNGRPYTFLITYNNNGNVDAVAVPMFIAVPKWVSIYTGFDFSRPVPLEEIGVGIDSFTLPLYHLVDSITLTFDTAKVIALIIPRIPAGYSGYLKFTIDSIDNRPLEIRVWTNQPLFGTPNSNTLLNANHSNLLQEESFVCGGSPGLGCLGDFVAQELTDLGPLGCIKSILCAYQSIPWTYVDPNRCRPNDPFSCLATTSSAGQLDYALAKALISCIPFGSIFEKLEKVAEIIEKWSKATSLAYSLPEAVAGDCPPPPPPNGSAGSTPNGIGSFDPNEKAGPFKFQQTNTAFNYSIFFENKATATAPAQEVSIIDTLDKTKFDISTFSFGPFGFGDTLHESTHQYDKSFSQNIDLRPVKNMIVKVEGRVDTKTGIAYWKYYSLDPATMLLTDDPTDGFLPPADSLSNRGEGWVSYSIKPYPWLESGTPIQNSATIIFDNNAPIITNEHINVIDKLPPFSHVSPLRSTQADSNFVVKWTGSDSISGIKNWDIYVSDNLSPYQYWKSNTSDSVDVFPGHSGHEYRFYSIAKDSADNIEPDKSTYEAITLVTLNLTDTLCAGDNAKIASGKPGPGNIYRWQLDNGSGFNDISNGGIYTNASSDTLILLQPSTDFTNYKFRCIVTIGSIKDTCEVHELYFINTWTGQVSGAWENPDNWDCGVVPDLNTNVIINASVPHFPIINSNASCKNLTIKPGATISISPAFNLNVTGKKLY